MKSRLYELGLLKRATIVFSDVRGEEKKKEGICIQDAIDPLVRNGQQTCASMFHEPMESCDPSRPSNTSNP